MLEVIIVDDERLARERLKRLLAKLPGARVVGEAADAAGLREQIGRHVPHIVILDIEMPGEDGLSVGRWLSTLPTPPALIFVTAHREFALEAFSAHAAGYLLKPVSAEQLASALQAVRRPTRATDPGIRDNPEPLLPVIVGRRSRLLPAGEILAFRAEDKGVTVFTREAKLFVDGSLKELASRFEPAGFLRVHRAWLVSKAAIRAIERDAIGHHWIEVAGLAEQVPVSRRQLSHLQTHVNA
ncbi:MAG: LytTR family DNA-binding domain-containing protein [Azoarcus sp.]|nr:LytTR family DNA-binding domain-containing protein [Azoarcus sp.]